MKTYYIRVLNREFPGAADAVIYYSDDNGETFISYMRKEDGNWIKPEDDNFGGLFMYIKSQNKWLTNREGKGWVKDNESYDKEEKKVFTFSKNSGWMKHKNLKRLILLTTGL